MKKPLINYTMVGLMLLCNMMAVAQESEVPETKEVPELVTDRPDQTESAMIVPVGNVQIETGILLENDKIKYGDYTVKNRVLSYPTTLFRIGIMKSTELRIEIGEYSEVSSSIADSISSTVYGVNPITVGAKFKLREEDGWKPEMAFLIHLGLTNGGSGDFAGTYPAPDFRFAFEHTLSDAIGMAYNIGAEWDGETGIPTGIYTLVIGAGITERVGAYIELYGGITSVAAPEHKFNAGLTYLIMPNLQLDLEGGFGMSENAPDSFVGFGISWRIPR